MGVNISKGVSFEFELRFRNANIAFFVNSMAWHAAGTYRIHDGRGGAGSGQLRFAPLNSWPDNTNLDKARRLLWPIKQKYGRQLSWGDLLILTGNVALESMNCPTIGFAGGRIDVWEPEDDVNWGQETTWLNDDKRYNATADCRKLEEPLGAVQMGLIYVNPTGPGGNPDPLASARDIRETFARMAMNDEETVALIAGGHTFGKCHGAATGVEAEPEAAPLEQQGLGWKHKQPASGTHTSGLEGAWTYNPTAWDNSYFDILFGYDWEQTKSPSGAIQWKPVGSSGAGTVPDAHDPSRRHAPTMLTSDLALRTDPIYERISRRFHQHPTEFQHAFAKAWYKLTHRDMGPYSRCLGPEVPPPQLWQDPVPPVSHVLVTNADQIKLKNMLLNADLSHSRLIATAWASASTYRQTDKRGGANGARLRLAPQNAWHVNEPTELARALEVLGNIQSEFNATSGSAQISMADLIVLGGCAAVEAAVQAAGYTGVVVPFTPGRTDATPDMTDMESFQVLEPNADGFRNYVRNNVAGKPEHLLVDKAYLLGLTAPEMTVLLGGLRVLEIGTSDTSTFTRRPGVLTNDFFVNLLDMSTVWTPDKNSNDLYLGHDRQTGELKYKASRVDLVFGSHSVLRALAEEYACHDAGEKFVADFCNAFAKVMDASGFSMGGGMELPRASL